MKILFNCSHTSFTAQSVTYFIIIIFLSLYSIRKRPIQSDIFKFLFCPINNPKPREDDLMSTKYQGSKDRQCETL